MVNNIEIVGSSTLIRGSATGFRGSATVSPISGFSKPVSATMSPAVPSATAVRPSLSKTSTLTTCSAIFLPSAFIRTTFCSGLMVPLTIRPVAIRPTNSE